MANIIVKEVSDEALLLKKILQKYKLDIKQDKLSKEESLQHIENMVKISSIIYAKLEYVRKL
jgi:lipopolysaccharide biosynthesis glycosyltransferase